MFKNLLLATLLTSSYGIQPLTNNFTMNNSYEIDENDEITIDINTWTLIQNTNTFNKKYTQYNTQEFLIENYIYYDNTGWEKDTYDPSDYLVKIHDPTANKNRYTITKITPYNNTQYTNFTYTITYDLEHFLFWLTNQLEELEVYIDDYYFPMLTEIRTSTNTQIDNYINQNITYQNWEQIQTISTLQTTLDGYINKADGTPENYTANINIQTNNSPIYIISAEIPDERPYVQLEFYSENIETWQYMQNPEWLDDLKQTGEIMPPITNIQIKGTITYPHYTTEVIDIPSIMFDVLTMPFTFISQAFNLTIFPGTPYQINIATLIFSFIGILILVAIITLIRRVL